ncbi:pentapeptide repeat-containing protein [Actinomadura geliboluensis]|uniref:pentapeptide repeat-containing protein n=1 Tax=Actinomadura geliboluensis TaxID=882440 RepID=UPI003693CCB1
MGEGTLGGEDGDNGGQLEPATTRWWKRLVQIALVIGGVALASAVAWILGPGAEWWLVHVDGVKVGGEDGLVGKDLAAALDTVRGRAMTMGTGLLAAVAIYYTANNASSARRSAQAALDGVKAARRTAQMTEAAQRRTFELTEQGQNRTHELTERGQNTDRFTAAVTQLGDTAPAIQLGGVHALAGLADDAPEFRQTCIDVLCAFLRLPYDPAPSDGPDEDSTAAAEHAEARKHYRAVREVRHTIIRIIGNHLNGHTNVSWQGHDLDFTDVVFDGGDFRNATFNNANVSFRNARFVDGAVNFDGARFKGNTVDFDSACFEGGAVRFRNAEFIGGTVTFVLAHFEGGMVTFSRAHFEGGAVNFDLAFCKGGVVDFGSVRFEGGSVNFRGTFFEGSRVDFMLAHFGGTTVDFGGATGRQPDGLPNGVADHLT